MTIRKMFARLSAFGCVLLTGTAFAQPIVKIGEIQGEGHISPYVGERVTTTGIVTAVAFNGYYVQDPNGDGNPLTSDGMFVFDRRSPKPSVGDEVEMTDVVEEFIPGGPDTGNLSITQFAFPVITTLSSGNDLPDPVIIGQSGRTPRTRSSSATTSCRQTSKLTQRYSTPTSMGSTSMRA